LNCRFSTSSTSPPTMGEPYLPLGSWPSPTRLAPPRSSTLTTVIAKSSTLAFSKPFFNQGLPNRRAVPRSSYAQFLLLISGADRDQMDRMRTSVASMCAGWDVAQVRASLNEAPHDVVDPLVFAEAAELISAHKRYRRDVVCSIARALEAPLGGESRSRAPRGSHHTAVPVLTFSRPVPSPIRHCAASRSECCCIAIPISLKSIGV